MNFKNFLTPAALLRLGLAFTFVYAAISGFIQPENWVGWLPEFVRSEIWLNAFGVFEILMGLWLLSGWEILWAGLISGAALLGIAIFNLGAMLIVFRDVGLAAAAFALASIEYEKQNKSERN